MPPIGKASCGQNCGTPSSVAERRVRLIPTGDRQHDAERELQEPREALEERRKIRKRIQQQRDAKMMSRAQTVSARGERERDHRVPRDLEDPIGRALQLVENDLVQDRERQDRDDGGAGKARPLAYCAKRLGYATQRRGAFRFLDRFVLRTTWFEQ